MESIHGLRILVQVLVYGTTAVMATKLLVQALGMDHASRLELSRLHLSHPDDRGKDR
jgi:hypothetical protein